MDIEVNTKNWDHEPGALLAYGFSGDNRWVELKKPEDVANLIDAINEALGKLGISDRVGPNITDLLRSIISNPKRYLGVAPGSAYEACGIGAEVPQPTQPSKHEVSKKQHEGSKQGSTGAQQVSLPDEVHEGENDRFVATRDFDYDKGTFAVVIKDREQPGREVTVMFRLVRAGLTKVYTHVSVYSGGRVVLKGRGLTVDKILKQVRKELNTKAIRNDGPIADFIRRAYTLVIEEAKRVRDELKKDARKKLFEELRSNQEFLVNPLRYIVTDVLGLRHYGDEIAKKAGVLTIATAWLPDEYHAHCAITGPSSSGKSNLLKALYECTPKSAVLGGVLRASSSPKALFYAGRREEVGKVVRHVLEAHHKVVFYAEPTMFYNNTPEGSLARELFKLLLSDTEEGEALCHDTIDPDRMVYRQYCVDGRPVIITTIPDENLGFLGGQELSRLLLVSIDLNPEVEAEALRFIRRKSRFKEEFKRRALLVRFFLSLMPIVESVELDEEADRFIDDLLMTYVGGERIEKHIRRAEQDLTSLTAAYELLNYTARVIQEGKKPPRKLEKLIVGKEAVKYVWEILKDAFEAKIYASPLKGDKARIYKLIRDRGGPVRAAEILEAVSLSKKTVYTILRELLDEGRITQCGRGIYALPGKCGQSITNFMNEKQDNAQQGGEGDGPQ
jgi:hypothetical protein